MSATFKNAKKKLSQGELRKFMNEHKIKRTVKVDSPLAKYNDLGQLTCVLCQSIVRSEGVWNVHTNSKQHREKIEEAKQLKQSTNNFTTPKRSLNTVTTVPAKKLKGILKNSGNSDIESINSAQNNNFISNDTGTLKDADVFPAVISESVETTVDPKSDNAVIPEGFFDDPKQDAKVRHIDYKDPIEEEWERFQKAIRDANNESANIIAEDHEEATNERQLDEIDEQMKNWSKVLILEKKKTEVISTINSNDMDNMDHSDETDDEENFDEYLDWRSKKFLKS